MIPLNLTDSEYQSLQSIGDKVGDLTAIQALNVHGGLKVIKDVTAAQRDRAKLAANGGRVEPIKGCLSPDVYFKLSSIALSKDIEILLILLSLHVAKLGDIPIRFLPCRRVGPPKRKAVAKGDTVSFTMDTLVKDKDVTVTAMDANDVDLADPLPQTVQGDIDGNAYVEMIVPSGYAGSKIKFRIDKDVIALDEFGTHAAVTDDSEVHTLTVT